MKSQQPAPGQDRSGRDGVATGEDGAPHHKFGRSHLSAVPWRCGIKFQYHLIHPIDTTPQVVGGVNYRHSLCSSTRAAVKYA